MTTNISTIHDAIVTKIQTFLTDYLQLPNPYIIEENPSTYLKKGFGVAVGPGERTNRVIGCQVSWQRTFNVILVNYVTTTDSNTTVRETLSKGLLEDHFTVLSEFEKAASLSGVAIDAIVQSDTGITYTKIDGAPYYVMEIDLTCEYLEDLTS